MIELKPCPFCGGEVEMRPSDFRLGASLNGTDSVVYCPTCDEVFGERHNKSKLHLIEWWNGRAARTCHWVWMEEHNHVTAIDECQFSGWALDCGCYMEPIEEFDEIYDIDNKPDGAWAFCPICGAKVMGR